MRRDEGVRAWSLHKEFSMAATRFERETGNRAALAAN